MDTFEIPEHVLGELAKMEDMARAGVPVVPPPEFLANFVKLQRGMMNWKQETLASFAGVSLTTIERIERGENVSQESLDRVSMALGHKAGDFTKPRIPLRGDQVAQKIREGLSLFESRIPVPVRPLRTQPQVRELASCHCYLVDYARLGDAAQPDIENLREWLDASAFALEQRKNASLNRGQRGGRREVYAVILGLVQQIQRRFNAVALAGSYDAKTNMAEMPAAKIALIGFFPKATDPGAIKRQVLLAPESIDLQAAWQHFCDEP